MGRAERIVEHGNFADPAVENVLITARSGTLDPAAATKAAADDAADRCGSCPRSPTVGDADPAPGTAARCSSGHHGRRPRRPPATGCTLRDATAGVQGAHPELRVEEAGGASIDKAMDDTLGKDFSGPSCSACR